MNFDNIIDWLDTWLTTFGNFIDKLSLDILEIVGADSLWTEVLPPAIKDATLFGLMFGYLFVLFLGITIWKWAKKTIL